MGKMGDRTVVMLLMLLLSLAAVTGYKGRGMEGEEGEEEVYGGGEGKGSGGLFILEKSKQVVKTAGGEVKVVMGYRWKADPNPMHIGFITMEPNTLFIPHYMDTGLILFVRRGEVKIGWIYKDQMVEKQLKMGDINRIPAGSAFYMVNTGKGQRLQMICSIDTSESLGSHPFQSFFIGGGINPPTVLAGFDTATLTTAFNVTSEELGRILRGQIGGPIVYVSDEAAATEKSHRLASIMQLKGRKMQEEEVDSHHDDDEEEEEEVRTWTWRNFLNSVLGKDDLQAGKKRGPVRAPDSYNLFDREPDFRNDYGWSLALDEHDYAPLKHSSIGVYLVNLTAGSMLAPHVNPTATEYGVVLSGSGTIQVVFPNGSTAMNEMVSEGDVFWIPRYFPFCQIASRSGPFEFFGFTTSSRRNRPQFLVGASSVLRTMLGPELAAAFGVREGHLEKLVESQKESVILPSWPLPKERREEGDEPLGAA